MKKKQHKGINVQKRYFPMGRLLPGDSYVDDKGKYNEPATQEFLNDYVSRMVETFLENYVTGHTIADVNSYDDYVAGAVYVWEDENGSCHMLAGFDIVMKSILLLSNLRGRLEEPNILAVMARGDGCQEDLVNSIPSSLQGESLRLFAHWLMTKVSISETIAMTPAGKEMILNAVQSGLTRYL